MKFDWIDFAASWNEPGNLPCPVDKDTHNSTASLLSSLLRRRDAPYVKAFCWLRRDQNVLDRSDSPGVRHIEATFPYAAYGAAGAAGRLPIFADWLVTAIASGAPELRIDAEEAEGLKASLLAANYTYLRIDKLKHGAGEPRCEVRYRHGPSSLAVMAACKLPDGRTITRTLEDHPFGPHELVYGRAITRCAVGEGDTLRLETYLGEF